MALAPFFDKSALAASAILQGFSRQDFETLLEQQVVGIAFDAQAVTAFEGLTTLELSVNLLARLYPRIALSPLDAVARERLTTFETLARAINPDIALERSTESTVLVCIGSEAQRVPSAKIVYVGSDGWIAGLSSHTPVGSGSSENPFGAAAAACFGAANIFRAVVRHQLVNGDRDSEFRLSLLDLVPNAQNAPNPPLGHVSIGDAHVVGAGAIGNAALWTLARITDMSGTLHVIDGERVDLSNLQRYVVAVMSDVGSAKVDVAAQLFERREPKVPGFQLRGHEKRWGDYLATRDLPWILDRVAVAVDSALDRCAIQASLPKWIANAWTQPGDLGLSSHDCFGSRPCLACLYLPAQEIADEDELVSDAIGLESEADVQEIRKLLFYGGPVGEAFVRRIASARTVPEEALLPYAGHPLREFYHEVACGGVLLRLNAASTNGPAAEVPMAFQSALAGVLLAARLAAHAAGLSGVPGTAKAVIDLLRPLPTQLLVPLAARADGRCLCQDEDYRAAHAAKYGASGESSATSMRDPPG